MTSLRTYAVVSLLFTISYAFSLYSIFQNTWLRVRPLNPFKLNESYGLWTKCDILGYCRSFPDATKGDCTEYNFCTKWHVAQASMAFSGFLGGMIFIILLGLIFASYAQQSKGWGLVTLLLTIHAMCQMVSMFFIADLYNNSTQFYYGTSYDVSFIFCIVSWVVDIMIAVILSTVAILSPPAYYPL
ncbi:hypothetical protein K7432_016378 [Basidiobolus ranarum]|uniref:Uncharacterized protein n=1 Tax=Basidiobolus ranarum TaxID=34480 RepID=A0ABR2WEV2_9FUNG